MHKHTIDLLKRLLAATEEERLKWQEVPGKTAFSYLAGDFVVLVDADEEQASFRLNDAKGRSLEQAGKEELATADLGSGAFALSAVQRICVIARRQTLGTDEAIASVMEHLQNLGEGNDETPKEEAQKEEVEAPSEPSHDEPPFMEELAPEAEKESEPEPSQTSDHVEIKEEMTTDERHEEALEPPAPTNHEPTREVPKKKKKPKRSLFNLFGRKR
jgi:hypothetical protein